MRSRLPDKQTGPPVKGRPALVACRASRLLAGQTLVIIGRRAAFHIHNVLTLIGRARDLSALDGLGAAVIKALDALFPSRPMQHVQVPLIDIAWNKDVEALALADIGRAVSCQFNHPALI